MLLIATNARYKQCFILHVNTLTVGSCSMNKTELIDALSEETTFSKKDVARVLDSLFSIIVRSLKKGDKLQWSGFGTFSLSKRSARKGINPQTREIINLPATLVPKFKAGKHMRDAFKLETLKQKALAAA